MVRSRNSGGRSDRGSSARAVEDLTHHCVRAVAPGGDLVVLHVPSGVYLRMDGSAATIVDLLVSTGDAERAADELATRYSIPPERAATDVASVVTAITSLRASRSSTPRRPTASGAVATVRSWWRLPPGLKLPVVRATAVAVAVEAGLRLTDLSRLAARMHVPLAVTPEGGTGAVAQDADTVSTLSEQERRDYLATTWVLDRWLYDGTCLRRALVSGYFLRRHRPTLHLGLVGDGQTSHAWVEADGMSFNSVPVTGTFTSTTGGADRPDGPSR